MGQALYQPTVWAMSSIGRLSRAAIAVQEREPPSGRDGDANVWAERTGSGVPGDERRTECKGGSDSVVKQTMPDPECGRIQMSDPVFEHDGLRNMTFYSNALQGRADVSLFVPEA